MHMSSPNPWGPYLASIIACELLFTNFTFTDICPETFTICSEQQHWALRRRQTEASCGTQLPSRAHHATGTSSDLAGEGDPGGGVGELPQQLQHSQSLLRAGDGLHRQQVGPRGHQGRHPRTVPLLSTAGYGIMSKQGTTSLGATLYNYSWYDFKQIVLLWRYKTVQNGGKYSSQLCASTSIDQLVQIIWFVRCGKFQPKHKPQTHTFSVSRSMFFR